MVSVWLINGEQAVQEIPVLRNKMQGEVVVGRVVRRRYVNGGREQRVIN